MEISIRKGVWEDREALVKFNQAMALETEGRTLDPDRLREGVAGLMQHSEFGFYLVAECGGRLVGGLLVTFEWSDWRNGLYWWIQSVFVLPEFRRRGVYRGLYGQAQCLAQADGRFCGFRLYVEKENHAAQAVYQHLGMQEAPYQIFQDLGKHD